MHNLSILMLTTYFCSMDAKVLLTSGVEGDGIVGALVDVVQKLDIIEFMEHFKNVKFYQLPHYTQKCCCSIYTYSIRL